MTIFKNGNGKSVMAIFGNGNGNGKNAEVALNQGNSLRKDGRAKSLHLSVLVENLEKVGPNSEKSSDYQVMRKKVVATTFEALGEIDHLKSNNIEEIESKIAMAIAKYGDGKDKVRVFKVLVHECSQMIVAESITEQKDILIALSQNGSCSPKALVILMENLIASGPSASEIANILDSMAHPPHIKVLTGFLKQKMATSEDRA